jgi:outer membrane protein insertion porin family
MTALVLILALLAFPAAGAAAEDVSPPADGPPGIAAFAGLRVSRVNYTSEAPFSPGEFDELVPLAEGEALSTAAVRESILTLYRTGRFEKVEVLGRRITGGEGGRGSVEVTFHLFPRKTLTRVSFAGNLSLADRELSARVQLRRGEAVEDAALEAAARKLEEYYAFRGFPRTAVTVTYGFMGRTPEIEVLFAIREGERLRFGEVGFTGGWPIARARALALMASRLGDYYDGEKIEADERSLLDHLRDLGYPHSRVSSSVDRSNPARGAAVLFTAQTGDRYVLDTAGVRKGEEARIRRLIFEGLAAAGEPSRALSLAEARLRDDYLAQGYPFAAFSWEDREKGGERSLRLSATEGRPARLGAVALEDAGSLTDAEASAELALKRGDPFVRADVDEALRRLVALYRRKGFLSARCSLRPVSFFEEGDAFRADLVVVVEEGVRTLVREVSIDGGKGAVDTAPLLAELGLRQGDPYVPEELTRGKDRVLDRLGREGFLYAKATSGEAFADSRRAVTVNVAVETGPQVRAGAVLVSGNREVDARIIRLAADLPRGEVLTPDRIIEAQKRIYQLGMMESVEVRLAEEQEPSPVKELLVDVRERNRFVIGLRAGYSNEERFKGEISFTNRNVGGMSRSLVLLARGGSLGSLVSATYTIPWFLSRPIDLSLVLSDQVEKKESYTKDATTASLLLQRRFSERTVANLSYSFGGNRFTDVSPGAVLSPEDEGKTTVAFISPEVAYDARDDKFEPTRGSLADLRLELASVALGSRTEYWRAETAMRRFYPLGAGLVLGWVARAGVVKAYGQSREVIIDRRFFLGGQNTVRGYAPDSLGPRDPSGKPIGGNYLLNLDLEARYPIYGALRGVVFIDSGCLWLEMAPYDDSTPRVAAGAGLRWSTPIGPFSLDYGSKMNPATAREDTWYLHLSIGHAF